MSETFVADFIDSLPDDPDSIALDIGANWGTYTAKLAPKFGTVYAFEPHPDNVARLKANAPFENVEVVQKAISDKPGKLKLYICGPNPGGHTINSSVGCTTLWGHAGGKNNIEVEAITIDEFCKDLPVSFIKMDIEGAENFVWAGAVNTLKNNLIDIILETHQTVNTEALKEFFEDLGYTWYDDKLRQVDDVPGLDQHFLITNRKMPE